MKQTAKARHTQRRLLDRRLKALMGQDLRAPGPGWVRPIREALGVTAQQLARMLDVDVSTVLKLEKRESSGKVTLEVLERVARALRCRLVYAIVPETTLEEIVTKQARAVAERMIARAAHSMGLEAQATDAVERERQCDDLARQIKEEMKSVLWDG